MLHSRFGPASCRISRKAPAGYGELLRRRSRRNQRVIVEHRREPLLRLGHAPALARGVVLDLIALDLADAEIVALGMAEVEPAHGSARPHGEALGELEADPPLTVEQRKQARLLAVVGLRGIAGRRADAAVFFPDQLHVAERLLRGVAPEFPAHPLVQALGECLGEPIGERLDHDRGIIVVRPLEALRHLVLADAGGDHEGADVVGKRARARRYEIRERDICGPLAAGWGVGAGCAAPRAAACVRRRRKAGYRRPRSWPARTRAPRWRAASARMPSVRASPGRRRTSCARPRRIWRRREWRETFRRAPRWRRMATSRCSRAAPRSDNPRAPAIPGSSGAAEHNFPTS